MARRFGVGLSGDGIEAAVGIGQFCCAACSNCMTMR
jgi:hypothetical protein